MKTYIVYTYDDSVIHVKAAQFTISDQDITFLNESGEIVGLFERCMILGFLEAGARADW